MKVFLTGGSGDLAKVLSHRLQAQGDTAIRFDIRKPTDAAGHYIAGSILDRADLQQHLINVDCLVHIAAWHGYHEFTKQKNVYDFWDLNVNGTFNIFQIALENKVKNIIFISSESVFDKNGSYGWTKVMSEAIAERYSSAHDLNVITLRPRAFIPYWNKTVYQSFVEWAKWFWHGAVHIDDVAQAVMASIALLTKQNLKEHLVLPVDGAYEYSDQDLIEWDAQNPGDSFKKYYAKYYELAVQHGLDPTAKPSKQDMSLTREWLSYSPQYSLLSLLHDLAQHGEQGPPHFMS